ncbi:C40 family peptidase [Pseudoxanthomonas sacheonensis]|uniref:Cell wall-associated NlpC family hydrolase n=1 Tax=Pseudoxanthomonas sacheonensis TaxID=443615 RepID=A0ABU1RUL1_9GAMM|nr:cell wall-associated NlpC family hydrolase [Pseudoxanthomonas sacheonensis]
MTTDDLQKGLPAARRPLRGVTLTLFSTAALCLASISAQAQNAPVAAPLEAAQLKQASSQSLVAATADAVVADALASTAVTTTDKVSSNSVRDKAAQAAAATLTALLPRLAASDTMPMLDRSAMFAGDLSRLLANYDLSRTGVLTQQDSGGKVQTVLQRALTLLGTPYRWGGTSPDSGFDCSGLVGYVFRTALGIDLPRVSRDMARKSDAELIKNREDLQQGDLVFFGRRGRVSHVGIYVGEGRFLHSPSTGKDVRVDSLITGYWSAKFMQARRVAM